MGCGKSSVGRRLSQLLCCPFMDLDDVIEQQTGRSIPEIFATDGEATFRQMEWNALTTIVCESPSEFGKLSAPVSQTSNHNLILSLGGGTVMTPECSELVQERTECIYLRTSVDTLVGRLANEAAGRPLLAGTDLRNRIDSLMSNRASIYERTAHHIIDTDGLSIDEVAQSLLESVLNGRF